MHSKLLRLVTVDDDPEIRTFVRTIGHRLGFDVIEIPDSTNFSKVIAEASPRVIVLDLNLPHADGITLLRQLQAEQCNASLIILSGCDARTLQTVRDLATAYGLHVLGAVRKPPSVNALEPLLRSVMSTAPVFDAKDLQEALHRREIVVYYQPKAHWINERWVVQSAEALARWQHPKVGLVGPAAFIPLAEETGLIGKLTEVVMEGAVNQLRNWLALKIDISIAVNLSPMLVSDMELPDRMRSLMQKHHVPCSRLTLEVTESAALPESQKAMDTLARLRVLGFGLAIDDFGTGNSSLLQLFRMPFNELKIDRCFVSRVLESEEARRIVQATVDLAHSLGLTACAEGVESGPMLEFIQSTGCDMAQGYFISHPLPAEQIGQVATQWNRNLTPAVKRTIGA